MPSCLIPFAVPLSDAGRAALGALQLPRLNALLARLQPGEPDIGSEWSLSPPHERALGRALGWTGPDGGLPWAARLAAADGIEVGGLAWGLLTPAHWRLGTEQISMADPEALRLDEAGSRACFDAVRELFTSEGCAMVWGAPLRWYIAHESLADLPCAAPDRVIGRNVDAWLGNHPAARRLRRLQSEVQMLLYTHALNNTREAQRQLPVNSFWLSGCGPAQPVQGTPPEVDARLRGPALAEDWAAWAKAWETLDEGPLAALLAAAQGGAPVALTLAGERGVRTWHSAPRGLLQRLRGRFTRPSLATVLDAL